LNTDPIQSGRKWPKPWAGRIEPTPDQREPRGIMKEANSRRSLSRLAAS
jgi:hypothetical protein